jgi:hypothetical protein
VSCLVSGTGGVDVSMHEYDTTGLQQSNDDKTTFDL